MAVPASVYTEPWDIDGRLAKLGLTKAALMQAVQRGFAAWASCTANHPAVASGIWAWGETVCALRENLAPLNWTRLDRDNLALTLNAKETVAISVSAGDEDTGRPSGNPSTRSAKGVRTKDVVSINQLLLFTEMMDSAPAGITPQSRRTTWILLLYRDKAAREVRCELSRPISMTDEGYVDGWAERILLGSTRFDDYEDVAPAPTGNGGGNVSQTPEINVEIRKRG